MQAKVFLLHIVIYILLWHIFTKLKASSKTLQQFFQCFQFFCQNLTVHSFDILLSHSFDKWTLLWLTYTALTPKIWPLNFPQIFSEFNFYFKIHSLLWQTITALTLSNGHNFDIWSLLWQISISTTVSRKLSRDSLNYTFILKKNDLQRLSRTLMRPSKT